MKWRKGQSGNPHGRKKGVQNSLTIKTREALWAYIEEQSTQKKSVNPFLRAVDILRDSEDPALIMKCIEFLGDRLLPRLKAVEHELGAEARRALLHRYAHPNGHAEPFVGTNPAGPIWVDDEEAHGHD